MGEVPRHGTGFDGSSGPTVLPSLAAGSSATVTITATAKLAGNFTSRAAVSSPTNDPVESNNSAPVTVNITP